MELVNRMMILFPTQRDILAFHSLIGKRLDSHVTNNKGEEASAEKLGLLLRKVQDSNLSLESRLGSHHLHDLFSRVRSSIDVVDADNQVAGEDIPFQSTSFLYRMDRRPVLGRVDDNLQLSWRSDAIATNDRLSRNPLGTRRSRYLMLE